MFGEEFTNAAGAGLLRLFTGLGDAMAHPAEPFYSSRLVPKGMSRALLHIEHDDFDEGIDHWLKALTAERRPLAGERTL